VETGFGPGPLLGVGAGVGLAKGLMFIEKHVAELLKPE